MYKTKHNYRLRISQVDGYRAYLVRTNGIVRYMSADETPLALSNLVSNSAAELRFKLEDAMDGDKAALEVFKVLNERWKNNPKFCPKIEVIED